MRLVAFLAGFVTLTGALLAGLYWRARTLSAWPEQGAFEQHG